MARLFKERISKFGALVSLVAVTALLVLFSLMLPEFLVSTAGRIFAAAWGGVAILLFVAHARRVAGDRRRRVDVIGGLKGGRQAGTRKETAPPVRAMRG